MNIVIVQPNIRRYRADFYDALAKYLDHLTVVHFGIDESLPEHSFERIKLDDSRFGRLMSIHQLVRIQLKHDVSIVDFDINYPKVLVAAALSSLVKPVLFWGHGLGRRRIGQILRRFCLLWGKGVIVYGNAGRDQLLKAGISQERIFVARNTQVVPGFMDYSHEKKEYFLFVGRLQERKRIDLLLKAYAEYISYDPSASMGLTIVGDGPIFAALKEMGRSLKIDSRVKFVPGTTDPDKLETLYRHALAYVSPGHVGLGVLHGFAFGVPVVTFQVDTHAPEFENLVHDINGLVLEPSCSSLADSLLQLATVPELAERLGHEAFRTYIEKAHPDQMVLAFLNALKFATSARGRE